MELERILSNWIPIFLGVIALLKIIRVWLKDFEKTIEKNYQEKADDKSLHESIREIEKRLDALGANADGTLALLRFRLKEEISLALSRGYTTVAEYEVISEMYTAYKALGGNHTIKHMFEDYQELEVKKGEK